MHRNFPATRRSVTHCPVPVVGIIGGIGSGKSTISRWVAEHHHALVVDADQLGHEVLRLTAVQAALVQAFGSQILDAHGQIDRQRLAAVVFGASEQQLTARHQLERIVHPAIRARMEEQLSTVNPEIHQVVLLDAAVLLEAGWADACDAILFIDTPAELRQQRILAQRHWSAEDLSAREASQWSLERKQAAADMVIGNRGDIADTGLAVWSAIRTLFTGLT